MMPRWPALIVPILLALAVAPGAQRPTHGRLFPPEDLGILESPDRDEWQEPERIMDALRIADGSRVADLGAGGGWFTIRLARRVGPNGRVYAEDVQRVMIDAIKLRVANQRLTNVETILGTVDDPRLPDNLDAVLVVDAYPAFSNPVAVLRHIARALAPHGRLGIVDFKLDGLGGPGPPLDERLDPAVVRRDAEQAGLRLLREDTFLRYQYLLVFGR
ncbi:MAG: methyltransferase domain-containing protein [Acidobacteria bacterium]|nr:methyltransferase domain-containing protein [Acidobacteriota bacterium]